MRALSVSSMTTGSADARGMPRRWHGALRPCKGFRRRGASRLRNPPIGRSDTTDHVASRPYHAHVPAPLAPGFSETPLWHAGVTPPAGVDDPGPLPAEADTVIVGGGYCGITAAAELAARGRSAVVVEADAIGTGASTRNGGMVIPELKHGPRDLARRYGALAGELVDAVLDAFALVERLVDEWSIDCDYSRCGGLLLAHHERHVAGLHEAADEWQELLGDEVRFVPRTELHAEIGTSVYHAGLLVERTGGLQPAKYHAGLVRRALETGAQLHERTRATRIARRPAGGYRVETTRGAVDAREVLVATNAYADELVPELRRRVLPIGSFIIATEVLDDELARSCIPRRRMVYDAKSLLFYWRLSPDNRMVFGGRTSLAPTTPAQARDVLYAEMVRVHPQLAGSRVEHSWGGNVAITFDRLPHCGRVPLPDGGDVAYATGCNGTGIALATWFGWKAAAWLSGEEPPPAFAQLPFPAVPLHSWRTTYLPAVGWWFRAKDRLGLCCVSRSGRNAVSELRGADGDVEAGAVREPFPVAAVEVVGRVVAVEHDVTGAISARGGCAQAHGVDRAEPGVGDEHDDVGVECAGEVDGVAVGRERRARAARALDQADVDGRRATPSSAARSAIVNEGRPSASAAIGGAIATSYERSGGHTTCGSSPVAAASTSASVAPSPGANDCTGLRAATTSPRPRARSARRAATHVLPTSVPVPVTTTSRARAGHRRAIGGERGDERGRPARRCARRTARPAAATCRPATVGGRIAGTSSPCSSSAAAAAERRSLVAEHDRARSATGGRAARGRRARAAGARSCVALGGAHDRERGERGGGVGRGRRGGEDVGAGAVHEQVDEARRARRRSRRARRASSTACRPRTTSTSSQRRDRDRARRGPRRAPAARRGARTPRRARRPGRRRRPSRTRCR